MFTVSYGDAYWTVEHYHVLFKFSFFFNQKLLVHVVVKRRLLVFVCVAKMSPVDTVLHLVDNFWRANEVMWSPILDSTNDGLTALWVAACLFFQEVDTSSIQGRVGVQSTQSLLRSPELNHQYNYITHARTHARQQRPTEIRRCRKKIKASRISETRKL